MSDRQVNLLLFERDGSHYYTTIRDFSRLVGRQLSNHGHAVHCCRRSLHVYSSQELLDAHDLDCCHAQRTKFPEEPRCRFSNIQKQLTAPFVVYAEFESILQRVDDGETMDTTQGVAAGGDDEPIAASGHFQEHLPCSFTHQLVCSVVPDLSRPLVSYRGEDAGEMFVRKLQEEAEQLFQEYINTPRQLLELTDAELRSFHTATRCHICNQRLGGDKVRDHCHIMGFYRGASHSRCNLEYRISKSEWKLPVVMHNLKGYDGHLIVKALKNEFVEEVRVIPQNMENYLAITVDRLKFIDSLQFVSQFFSLAKTLEVDGFKYIREEFPIQHEFELIKRKGVDPYDYMDSFARFDESRLPSQDAFFSKLSDSPCSDTEYAHATQLWTAIECESMAD